MISTEQQCLNSAGSRPQLWDPAPLSTYPEPNVSDPPPIERAQELTAAHCDARLTRAKKLLHLYPASAVDFILLSDEKIFIVAPPVNSFRMTVSICRELRRNGRLLLTDSSVHVRPSASHSWCRSESGSGTKFLRNGAKYYMYTVSRKKLCHYTFVFWNEVYLWAP